MVSKCFENAPKFHGDFIFLEDPCLQEIVNFLLHMQIKLRGFPKSWLRDSIIKSWEVETEYEKKLMTLQCRGEVHPMGS